MRVRVRLAPGGFLREVDAAGHAGDAVAGANPACAAVTALVRTAARACADRGVVVGGGAAARGSLRCAVRPRGRGDEAWLGGVTDMLLRGLADLRDEFPGVVVVVTEVTEE